MRKPIPFIILIFFLLPASVFAEATFLVSLKVFPPDYALEVDGSPVTPFAMPEDRKGIRVSPGEHTFSFTAEGYEDLSLPVSCGYNGMLFEAKLEKTGSPLRKVGVIPTGYCPKAVEFTPDGRHIVTTLLEGQGIEVFSAETFEKIDVEPIPAPYAAKKGFVEIAFVKSLNEMWVSQMTTGMVHIYDLNDFSYKTGINGGGTWSKVITISGDEKRAYLSNWVSNDISVIDIPNRKLLHRIYVGGTPRGMALSEDGKYLYVCGYDSGFMYKVNLETKKVEKSMEFRRGAKRHIVADYARDRFYVSDMFWGSLFIISGRNDELRMEVPVDEKLNTIALTSDGRYLFIASRGANNPKSYLLKGWYFGKIYIFDTNRDELIGWIWGGNQPTGLAVSPDNSLLAFSNFLDYNIEVYRTGLE